MPILDEPVTLFGGYVENANVSVGYGAQSSTCQISIVYEGDGPTTKTDYTKNFPSLGTCVGFTFGELEFVGIFQKWSESKSLDGYRYDIILESASKVLEGVNVILEGFQGSSYPRFGAFTTEINNVWNIFGELENYAYGGIFGGANTNSAGFLGLLGLEMMERASRGELSFGGPIIYAESIFKLDFTELKQVLSSLSDTNFYRIEGQSKTISAIIEEACSLIMYDYIVEILPSDGSSIVNGPITDCTIYIRMIDRSKPPDLGVIRGAIKTYEKNGELINSNFGQELINTVTQKLVMGGFATRYVFVDDSEMIQLWGKTKGPQSEYCTKIVLDDGTQYPVGNPDLTPNIMEVRAAMHSFDSWILFHLVRRQLLAQTGNAAHINIVIDSYASHLFTNVAINNFVISRIAEGTISAIDLIDSSLKDNQQRNVVTVGGQVYEVLQKIHNSIKNAGEEYWGRKYYVNLPIEPGGKANNLKFTSEDFQYINSWEIADSAWHEYPTPYGDISFYDGDGKLKNTACWNFIPVTHDYTNLGDGYCFGTKGGISATVNVDKDIYWGTEGGFAGGASGASVARCVVDLPAVAIFDQYTTEHNALFHFLQLYFGYSNAQLAGIFTLGSESGSTIYGISPDRAKPTSVGISQVSTRFRWGPWWNYKTLNGASEVIVEDSLTPETFGGIDNMTSYGLTYAYVANAEVTGVESGSIELAGAPIGNIGKRFLVSGPYVTGINVSMGISGITSTYNFNTWTPQFGKLAKYNADRFANFTKNIFRMVQDKRSKLTARPFQAQQYRDKAFKNNRPFSLAMAGSNGIGAQMVRATGPTDKDRLAAIHAGQVVNQLGPILLNPDTTYHASMEQFFSPVHVAKNPKTTDIGEKPTFQLPVDNYSTVADPTATTINPYFSLTTNDYNHTIINGGMIQDLNIKKMTLPMESAQTMGLRGPLIMSGWGYGVDMKHIPFDDDITEHHEDTGGNRNLWKTGPVDLRWDEERKVWGPGFDFIEGFLTTAMTVASSKTAPTTFKVEVYRNKDKTIESDGISRSLSSIKWQPDTGEITGINRSTKLKASSGAYVVLMRINYEWRPIYVDC